MTLLHVIFGLALPQSKTLDTPMHGGEGFLGRAPQTTACTSQARVTMKQQDRSSECDQVALDFAMKTFFFIFLVFTSKFEGEIHTKGG